MLHVPVDNDADDCIVDMVISSVKDVHYVAAPVQLAHIVPTALRIHYHVSLVIMVHQLAYPYQPARRYVP